MNGPVPGAVLQAVLFDLDGTLADTSMDFVTLINRCCARRGMAAVAPEAVRARISQGIRGMATLCCGEDPATHSGPAFDSLCQQLLDDYALLLEDPGRASAPGLFEDMDKVLTTLEAGAVPWGVVTNKPRRFAEPVLQGLGLESRCAVLVCPDDVGYSKPDPEPVLLAASTLGCPPASCVFIGDSPVDIQAGQAAAMVTLAAAYGFLAPDDQPADWEATAVMDSPAALLRLLEGPEGLMASRALHEQPGCDNT